MKKMKLIVVLILIGNYCTAQTISVAPHVGMNLNSFGYPKSNIDPNSILSYPKDINLGYQLGGDLIYTKGNKKHVLSISSVPLGVQFRGEVLNRDSRRIVTIFKNSSNDRQPLISYQFFVDKIISKTKGARQISLFYGGGLGVGLNRSKEFYRVNSDPIQDGSLSLRDSIFWAFIYPKKNTGLGYFLMPEVGFTYYNRDEKPVVNISFCYYVGLKTQVTHDLLLQYGKLGTSYFEEERPIIGTRGSFFGAKLSFPFQLYTIKKSPNGAEMQSLPQK